HHDDRTREAIGETPGDDADDPGAPAFTPEHDGSALVVTMLANFGQRLVEHAILERASFETRALERGGEGLGALSIPLEQEPECGIGRAEAARGVQAGRD